MKNHKRVYREILNILATSSLDRARIIEAVVAKLIGECGIGECEVGRVTKLRGDVGAVISEMEDGGLIVLSEGGRYTLASSKPVALRAEGCESEMLKLLRERPMTKAEIRDALIKTFGTDKTASTKDDNILFSLIGQVARRLVNFGIVEIHESKYRIAPEKQAKLGDMLSLKADFTARLHSKGGEFFEHYILTLLSKHLSKNGKTVTESYVTGGSMDGGVDGIIRTVDTLGFREYIMIQAKNRLETTNETTVRGFYGAVCAMQGSRGIFATTSDFHPAAEAFLDGIDNCVGLNSDGIFKMAIECLYGIKRRDGKYFIDTKIL